MGYLVLWIESLVCSLLLVATAVAGVAGLGGRWRPIALATLISLVPFAFYAALIMLGVVVEIQFRVKVGWFWPAVVLTLAYLVGAIALCMRGLVRDPIEGRRAAATWPRGKLALALAVALVLHAMTFSNLDAGAKQSLATVRAESTALALSVAPPRPSENDNAAVIYDQVFEAIGREPGGPDTWPPIWQAAVKNISSDNKPTIDYRDPAIGEFLAQHAGELVLIRAAAARPSCFFDRDYGRPTADMLLPELAALRTCARLLALDARWLAGQGDLSTALTDVNSLFNLARHVGSEPILVSFLVGAAIDRVAGETLQAVLDARHPTLDELANIRLDATVSYRRMMHRCLRMQEAFLLNSFASLENMDVRHLVELTGEVPFPAIAGLGSLYRVFLMSDDVAATRRTMHECDRLPTLTYEQFHPEAVEFEANMRESPPGIVTGIFMPSLEPSVEIAFRTDAERHLAEAAVAMHRYYAQHGKFPNTLDALAPGEVLLVPRDPYDEKPLKLTTTETGWILYCVGPNGKDEGGKRTGKSELVAPDEDLTFEYTSPQAANESKPPENP